MRWEEREDMVLGKPEQGGGGGGRHLKNEKVAKSGYLAERAGK